MAPKTVRAVGFNIYEALSTPVIKMLGLVVAVWTSKMLIMQHKKLDSLLIPSQFLMVM